MNHLVPKLPCANVLSHRKPVACGVTSLGMDHVKMLGGTLESIAWQKAGIFKVFIQKRPLEHLKKVVTHTYKPTFNKSEVGLKSYSSLVNVS